MSSSSSERGSEALAGGAVVRVDLEEDELGLVKIGDGGLSPGLDGGTRKTGEEEVDCSFVYFDDGA